MREQAEMEATEALRCCCLPCAAEFAQGATSGSEGEVDAASRDGSFPALSASPSLPMSPSGRYAPLRERPAGWIHFRLAADGRGATAATRQTSAS